MSAPLNLEPTTAKSASAAKPSSAAIDATAYTSPPERAVLEREAARVRRVDYVLIALLVPCDIFLIWQPVAQGNGALLAVAAMLLWFSSTFHVTGLLPFFRWPGRRLQRLSLTDTVGRYTSGQVRRIVVDLLKPHRESELPEIYITDAKQDGAFVLNSLFFNFLRPLNAIYISRYLFQILKPGEIRAILTHELAHFYGYIRPLACVRLALMVFNALLPIQLWSEGILPSAIGVVVAWALFSAAFNLPLNRWLLRHSRCFEHLSDLRAARTCGILNVVNGLFACLKTSEVHYRVQARLLQAIRDDDTLSLRQIPALLEEVNKALPDTALTLVQVNQAVDMALSGRPVQGLRRKLTRAQVREEARQIDAAIEALMINKEFSLLDWGRFDVSPSDGRVNTREYPELVRNLRAEPAKQLFAVPEDHAAVASRGTHPTIRERILFLEACRQADATLALEDPRHSARD